MKKTTRTLSLILALLVALGMTSALAAAKAVTINDTNFPDATFRSYVTKQFDTNKNGKLSAAELNKADAIVVTGKKKIKSLKGIEYFTKVDRIYCDGTSITSLDVRKNTALVFLHAENTPLASIKLGKKKSLDELGLGGTKLASVDISGCPNVLEAVTDSGWPYTVKKGVVTWDGNDVPLSISTGTKVMNGKTVVFTYAKPTTFKFSKKSATLKLKDEDTWPSLWALLKRTPANTGYATTFTCDKKGIIKLDKNTGDIEKALKKGTVVVTAKSGGKTAKITVNVK